MSLHPQIRHFNLADEFYTAEKCYIIELSNTEEDPDVSIARARISPGISTRWHRVIDTTERYVIQQGKGLVEVGDLPAQEVGPGDVVIIPASCRQRITNTGQEELILLAICNPRFRQEAYEDIEASQT